MIIRPIASLAFFDLSRQVPKFLIALVLGVCAASATEAAEIRVLTAGAFKPVVVSLAATYEAATGNKVTIENDTAGALIKKVQGGAPFDVIILTPAGLTALSKQSLVARDTLAQLAKVGIGVAVKAGDAQPDISTTAALKQALLTAKSIAMIDPASGGSSGIYLMQLFTQWGIVDQLKPKLVLVPGGLVATRLLTGEATVALHQISEIMAVKGATLVGPLPEEIQNYTVYAGGVASVTKVPAEAREFLALLTSSKAIAVLTSDGMEPPLTSKLPSE